MMADSTAFWEQKRQCMVNYDSIDRVYDGLYEEEQFKKFQIVTQSLDVNNDVVLDLGSGSGLFVPWTRGCSAYIGIDLSKSLLKNALTKYKTVKNASFIRADIDYLPFRSGVFDKTFVFTVLQNSPVPRLTLNEACRISKNTAQLVITGLKKAFSKNELVDLLEDAHLAVQKLMGEELRDIVAICEKVTFYSKTTR